MQFLVHITTFFSRIERIPNGVDWSVSSSGKAVVEVEASSIIPFDSSCSNGNGFRSLEILSVLCRKFVMPALFYA